MGQRACSKRHVVDCGACRIMVLSILTVRQYHYIQRLRTNQKLLESIFDQSTHYIGIFDLEVGLFPAMASYRDCCIDMVKVC